MSGAPADTRVGINQDLQQQLIDLAIAGGEDEVCGLLVGRGSEVQQVVPVPNAAATVTVEEGRFRDRQTGEGIPGSKRIHYFMDPHELQRLWRHVEDELDLDVLGFYHSHTHSEAVPSATDIRLAGDAGTMYWVLVGLKDPSSPSVRAWRILKQDPAAETGELLELDLT